MPLAKPDVICPELTAAPSEEVPLVEATFWTSNPPDATTSLSVTAPKVSTLFVDTVVLRKLREVTVVVPVGAVALAVTRTFCVEVAPVRVIAS